MLGLAEEDPRRYLSIPALTRIWLRRAHGGTWPVIMASRMATPSGPSRGIGTPFISSTSSSRTLDFFSQSTIFTPGPRIDSTVDWISSSSIPGNVWHVGTRNSCRWFIGTSCETDMDVLAVSFDEPLWFLNDRWVTFRPGYDLNYGPQDWNFCIRRACLRDGWIDKQWSIVFLACCIMLRYEIFHFLCEKYARLLAKISSGHAGILKRKKIVFNYFSYLVHFCFYTNFNNFKVLERIINEDLQKGRSLRKYFNTKINWRHFFWIKTALCSEEILVTLS